MPPPSAKVKEKPTASTEEISKLMELLPMLRSGKLDELIAAMTIVEKSRAKSDVQKREDQTASAPARPAMQSGQPKLEPGWTVAKPRKKAGVDKSGSSAEDQKKDAEEEQAQKFDTLLPGSFNFPPVTKLLPNVAGVMLTSREEAKNAVQEFAHATTPMAVLCKGE